MLSAQVRGRRTFFYVLFEHQRDVEALMIVRMHIYMSRLWEHVITDEPLRKDVPPIMPLLLHHSETGWTAATGFQDVVAVDPELWPELRPYTPCFEMKLIDISEGQASRLVEQALTAMGKVALWCMSVAGDDARMEREIERIGAALVEVLEAPNEERLRSGAIPLRASPWA